jgi:hypothetical protein
MKKLILSLALLSLGAVAHAQPQKERDLPQNAFASFDSEHAKLTRVLKCKRPRVQSGDANYAGLYSCIAGKEETVKVFVNEDPKSRGEVKNVKFLWNDYWRSIGAGTHADAATANAWVGHIAALYGPDKKEEILRLFKGNKDDVVYSKTHILVYTYSRGPAIDERMYVVTRR